MNKQQEHKRIIISGGGTGGHVFPAIAIADALTRLLPDPEILFVGAKGRMEMQKVPDAGYNIMGLPVEGFRRKLSLGNLRVIVKLAVSLKKAEKIIQDFKPDAVVGVGGYASGPVLRKAERMGIPTLIQEQNSYAGLTNRLLARKAGKICVAYDGMDKYFPADKLVLAGNPVRREIRELSGSGKGSGISEMPDAIDRTTARSAFGMNDESRVLLVLGGSLGARSINEAVVGNLDRILESGLRVIWQCGQYYYREAVDALAELPAGRIALNAFIAEMDRAYLAADLIIARAGAITISELCHVGKPAILIPSPNVAEDHQTKNAKSLSTRSAAVLIPDSEAGEHMIPMALELLDDAKRMNELSENISKLAIRDAADRIAREVAGIMKV
jgi:UDP-N-acetylglucosamine--N-acetylmuramyl-(pentapeptide) pyrophosphoryl-undecaprenol N-acetylglucosamine transferase